MGKFLGFWIVATAVWAVIVHYAWFPGASILKDLDMMLNILFVAVPSVVVLVIGLVLQWKKPWK